MKKLLSLFAAAGAASIIAAGSAMAQSYPANIDGTWTILANNTQAFTFTVQSQSSDSPCALITGVIGAPNDTLIGYYCPATGAVSFLRNSAASGATFQVFTGAVSWAGSQNQMTGNFSNYSSGSDVGAFSFSATIPGS
jgi:hypothetical protein